jgi:hypothetical protein
MPELDATGEQARMLVERAADAARALLALGTPRQTVDPELRERIGERDHWICALCERPVDPTLKIRDITPETARGYQEHLSCFSTLTDVPAVIDWVGQDEHRARAARRWFDRCAGRSPGRADAEAYAAHRAAVRPLWKTLWRHIGPILRERDHREQMCASLEHRWPLCLGGGYEEENLAIAHRGCNTAAAGRRSEFAQLLASPDHARELLGALEALGRGASVDVDDVARRFGHVEEALCAARNRGRGSQAVHANLPTAAPCAVP